MDEALLRLKQLDISEIPKKFRADMASLARRLGEIKLAVRILQPNVYGVGRPEYEDLIEYASLIRRLGLTNQAMKLLDRAPEIPKTHLNRALCHIYYWNYQQAEEELGSFLKFKNLGAQEELVGRFNMIGCLVENQHYEKAYRQINALEDACKNHNSHLMINLHETKGQIYFKTGELDKAINLFESLKKQTGEKAAQSLFFIQKWLLLSQLKKGLISKDSQEIKSFFKNSRANNQWELIRDFTWQLAQITNDSELMNHVFFGTPYFYFREHMFREWGRESFPLVYGWRDGRSQKLENTTLDFYKLSHVPIAYGKSVHRLMMLIAADFYHPWSAVRIFDNLFPDELFDPNTSLKKVYRLIEQLGQVIKKSQLHLTLETTSSGYRLRPTPGCLFTMHREMIFSSREQFLSQMLLQEGLVERFRATDACSVIPLSQHQWYRAFRSMAEMGYIEAVSSSSNFYNLKKVS